MSVNPDRSRSSRRGRSTDTSGFTLIEVLVAFTVMATLLSVLYRGVVTLHAGSLAFDDHTRQQVVARAVLEDALAKRDLPPGRYTGIREGRRWTLVAKAIDLSAQMPAPMPDDNDRPAAASGQPPVKKAKLGWNPQRLTMRIETKGKPLEIETIRLVKAEQPQ